MTAATPTPADPAAPARPPLWPQPIEVMGLTGEYSSGKSYFAASIAPGKATRIYDLEKSCAVLHRLIAKALQDAGVPEADSYFDRINVPTELLRKHPSGYKPIDTFLWWLADVRAVPAGKYRVIGLDPVSEVEAGLVEWVRTHPQEFGHTTGQYAKATGIMWGDVKDYWKSILADVASRCETFVFTSHMTSVWERDGPTGKRKAKGKDTLKELASLYLILERKKDAKGNVPTLPAAVVDKSRLAAAMTYDPTTGELKSVPALTPRIPVATPHAIRQYMVAPRDQANLTDAERAPDVGLTDDDKAELKYQTAKAEREAEEMRLARLDREQQAAERRQGGQATRPATAASQPNGTNGHPPAANGPQKLTPDPNAETAPGRLTHGQRATLDKFAARLLRDKCGSDREQLKEKWAKLLSKRGVQKTAELTPAQADEVIAALHTFLDGNDPLARRMAAGDAMTLPPAGPDPKAPAAPAAEATPTPP